jgi:hypothetical protein
MISVQSVYESVKNLANKDQKGFVTPEVFNSFAKIAQLNVFQEVFMKSSQGRKLQKGMMDAEDGLSFYERNRADLGGFSKTQGLVKSGGGFNFPDDFYSLISVKTRNIPAVKVDIIYDERKAMEIVNSTLSAPTEEYPVALVSNKIEVFPTSTSKVDIKYYRTPKPPRYSMNVYSLNGSPVEQFDPSSSENFELPSHYEQDVVFEIAKMVGVNLKEQIIQAYGQSEDNQS